MTESKYFTSDVEKEKREELKKLMCGWKKRIKSKPTVQFSSRGKKYLPTDCFNPDGFFPGYFSAKRKILFLGREFRRKDFKISELDRIMCELEWFEDGAENINRLAYWRRVLKISYGIQHEGDIKFEKIPSAKEIVFKMLEKRCFNFALMNISKYSNSGKNSATANYQLINRFLADSDLDKRNFIREEIELLEPDIIITANLWESGINQEYLDQVFPASDLKNEKSFKNKIANYYDFELGKRIIKLIDLYHFSARGKGKNDKDCFYTPVMKLLFDK